MQFRYKVVFVQGKNVHLGSILTILWSQCTGDLCSQVIYIVFLDGRNLKWSLYTGGLCSEVVFNIGWTVYRKNY